MCSNIHIIVRNGKDITDGCVNIYEMYYYNVSLKSWTREIEHVEVVYRFEIQQILQSQW